MSSFTVKIKCDGCNKHKSQELFSKRALAKYQESQRQHARNPKTPIKTISCSSCSNTNREELKCSHCDKTMPLERFNKAQRKKADDALCLDCSQERIDREADHEKEVQEVIIVEEFKQMDLRESAYKSYSSRLSSAQRSRLDSANSRIETDTNPASEDWFVGNDLVSVVGSGSSAVSSSSTRPTTGTGWDGFTGINRTTATPRSGSNVGFAKQNAVPKNPVEKAQAQYQREKKRDQEQEEVVRDESDESDNGEDPY